MPGNCGRVAQSPPGGERPISTLGRARLHGRSRLPLAPWRDSQPEEHENRQIELQDILVVQPADARADLGLGNSGVLVHHQARRCVQAIALVRLDGQTEQWRVGLVGGEGADRGGAPGGRSCTSPSIRR